MSGRDPSTWILREAGRGAMAAESTFASRAKNWSLAFIVLLVALRRGAVDDPRFPAPALSEQVPRVFSHQPGPGGLGEGPLAFRQFTPIAVGSLSGMDYAPFP